MSKRKKKKMVPSVNGAKSSYVIAIIAVIVFVCGSVFAAFNHSQQNNVMAGGARADGELESDIASIRSRVAQYPDDVSAWTKLGNLYFDNGQAAASIEAYQESLRLNPAQPDVWTDMGVMFREVKDFSNALKSFAKAVEIDPKHEIARLNSGIVLLYDLNDKPGAAKAWEELLAINPAASTPDGEPLANLVREIRGVKQLQLLKPVKPS